MQHLVKKFQFEMNCCNETLAFDFTQNFAVRYLDKVQMITDEVLSKYATDDEFIIIDKLDLDLGSFSSSSFSERFEDLFKLEMTQKIEAALRQSKTHYKQRLQERQQEIGYHYLENGVLPWFAQVNAFDLDAFIQESMQLDEQKFIQFLLHHSSDKIWRRIALQSNDGTQEILVNKIPNLKSARQYLSKYLDWLVAQNKVLTAPINQWKTMLNAFLLKNSHVIITHYPAAIKTSLCTNFVNNMASEIPEIHQNNLLQVLVQHPDFVEDNSSNIISHEITQFESNKNSTLVYSVQNAGLVLIAAFLKEFFKNLNLTEDGKWIDFESQEKAVHLLHFFATGETHTGEYAMTFEKLLCGIHPEFPIKKNVLITEQDRKEIQELTASIISHWRVLKNTTIEGLRTNFLHREGLMHKEDENWVLSIERKTMDLLLDSIPWRISQILLPWNEYFINVEW